MYAYEPSYEQLIKNKDMLGSRKPLENFKNSRPSAAPEEMEYLVLSFEADVQVV